MPHREMERADSAGRLADESAPPSERRKLIVNERNELANDVILVRPEVARVHVLTAAVLREAIRHGEDRRRHLAARDRSIELEHNSRANMISYELLAARDGGSG